MGPPPHLSRAALAELDRLAIEELGLPSAVLMENAGRGAAEAILRELGERPAGDEAEVAVFLGAGNNAGDGYVAARHLHNAGRRVLLCETAAPQRLSADAALFRGVTAAMGLEHVPVGEPGAWERLVPRLERSAVWVDALLGTGARGEPREPLAGLIEALVGLEGQLAPGAGARIVALDLPSGLDADTGRPARATIRAARTLTFAASKRGFLAPGAARHLGRVEVLTIGTPPELALRALAGVGESPRPPGP